MSVELETAQVGVLGSKPSWNTPFDQSLVISQASDLVSLPCPMVECPVAAMAVEDLMGLFICQYHPVHCLSGTVSCLHFSEHPEQCLAYSWSAECALDALECRAITGEF